MQWLLAAVCLIWATVINLSSCLHSGGILYPRESPTREVKSLDGIWNFKLSKPDHFAGFRERWYHTDLTKTGKAIPMPVPSSYNDITTENEIHDHVGLAWYDRTFYVPDRWRSANNRVWLRFGGVHYSCQVWINGHSVMSHEIGHLPFVQEVTSFLAYGTKNRITVVVDNTLLLNTIPQGQVVPIDTPEGKKQQQTYTFDFFNYAGIQRSVYLYTTPTIYLDDITVNTDIAGDGTTGTIHYNVSIGGMAVQNNPSIRVYADLIDQDGVYISRSQPTFFNSASTQAHGSIKVKNVRLWWPYLMDDEPGYMYSVEGVKCLQNDLRWVKVDNSLKQEDFYL